MGMWSTASKLASQTPPSRNRYVDFLRAASITVVVFGHWLAAAPELEPGGHLVPTHLLAVADWTHWLTWAIQVMPLFFVVGLAYLSAGGISGGGPFGLRISVLALPMLGALAIGVAGRAPKEGR